MTESGSPARPARSSIVSIFLVFLRLGLTSFGGPIAHIGYFREEFVSRKKWIDDAAYADLVALCQFLPGPASSQVGMGIGLLRGGYGGAIAAWVGFTAPSAFVMIAAAYGVLAFGGTTASGWVAGLMIAAVAVVAQAVWGMARSLCPDRPRASLAVAAAVAMLFMPSPWTQVAVILIGALAGLAMVRPTLSKSGSLDVPVGRWTAIASLLLFVLLLAGLPILAAGSNSLIVDVIDIFYRSGALVFGGGHVVLPLLQAETVPSGLVSADAFLAGYGAAQAVPGPLFTFAGYLGAAISLPDGSAAGWPFGMLALAAIFIPAFLLVVGALPFWAVLRQRPRVQSALAGVNAAVVGILAAAFYDPVWVKAVTAPADAAVALAAFALLQFWKLPPWLVVGLCAVAGIGLARFA